MNNSTGKKNIFMPQNNESEQEDRLQIKKPLNTKLKINTDTHVKRQKNAYAFFNLENKGMVLKDNPEFKNKEILITLSKMWDELREDQKTKYKELAERDRQRYAREIENLGQTNNVVVDQNKKIKTSHAGKKDEKNKIAKNRKRESEENDFDSD